MASQQKAKPASSKSGNAVRNNGKAFKKRPKTNQKKRTPEAELRYVQILKRRQERREAGMERHRQELEERAARQAEIAAEIEEEARRRREARRGTDLLVESLKALKKQLFSHAS